MTTAISSRDCSVLRFTFLRLCVSEADTTTSTSVNPASSARRAPRRFGASAEYRTEGTRATPAHTASASAICGIASARTNETASIRLTPVCPSRSISAIFAGVGTGSSFCSPSRGPTSRSEIRSGTSLMSSHSLHCLPRGRSALGASLASGGCPRHRDTTTAPGGPYAAFGPVPAARSLARPLRLAFLDERRDSLPPVRGGRGRAPGRVLHVKRRWQADVLALPHGPFCGPD